MAQGLSPAVPQRGSLRVLHKLWFRALASSAPWFPRPPCQRVSRGWLRSFRIAGLTALLPGWQHPAWSRTWLRVPPGQGNSTVCPCARPSVALSEGNGARLQLASWLLCPEKAPPHPPAACSLGTSFSQRNSPGSDSLFCLLSWPGFIHSFMTAFSQLDPLRCSCSPSPPLPCPWSLLVGRAPWEMGSWRWNSLLAAPSPSPRAPHRLVLIFSLSFRSLPSEELRREDHLRRMFSPPKSSL